MDIRETIARRAAAKLKATGYPFEVHLPNGEVLGGLPKKATRKPRAFPHGAITAYVTKYLKDMSYRDIVRVPYGGFPRKLIQAGACAYGSRNWSAQGSVTTRQEERGLTVMRLHDPSVQDPLAPPATPAPVAQTPVRHAPAAAELAL